MAQERRGLSKTLTQKLLKAIREFDLIRPGDKVLVGLSGGKDSSFLLYALAIFQQHQIIPFELGALSIDLGFAAPMDVTPLRNYCNGLNVPFFTFKTEIAKYAFSDTNPEGPCARCSFLRRGAMNRFARENGFTTVALGHHQDDAVETFLMSIIFSGQIKTFMPRTELSRSGIKVIRPLVYVREAEIRQAIREIGIEPIPSPCPIDGQTKRAETKELIRRLSQHDNRIFNNLASAMREGRPIELWPEDKFRPLRSNRNKDS